MHAGKGIPYSSVWFVTLAVYYIQLAVMRASLPHYVRSGGKSRVSEWRRYRLCGMILLCMNAALVSMLSLETAMLTQFGAADDPRFRRIMTTSTGTGVSILVVGIAFFMIVRSTRQMKQIRQEEGEEIYG